MIFRGLNTLGTKGWGMAQWIKSQLPQCEELTLSLQHPCRKLGRAALTCHLSTGWTEGETWGSVGFAGLLV